MPRSTSRRKACDICVRAKRRCDGRQPCTTCVRKKTDCSLVQTEEPSLRTLITTIDRHTTEYDEEQDDSTVSLSFAVERDMLGGLCFERPTMNYILPPFTLAQLAPFRLQKCVQRLQGCIASMAQKTSTSFLKLSSPDSTGNHAITNTFLACTAYQSRTKANRVVLNRVLSSSFVALVNDLRRTISFCEQLSLVQAIVLFQIMLYFGDDEDLRTLAEHHAEMIQRSVWLFQQSYDSELVFPSIAICTDSPNESYDRWLLLESARRTILAHLFVKGMYGHLRDDYCDIVPALAELPISIEGDL